MLSNIIKSKLIKNGGGAGVGSYVTSLSQLPINYKKIVQEFDVGNAIFVGWVNGDTSTGPYKQILVDVNGGYISPYLDHDNVLVLSGEDLIINKQFTITCFIGENNEVTGAFSITERDTSGDLKGSDAITIITETPGNHSTIFVNAKEAATTGQGTEGFGIKIDSESDFGGTAGLRTTNYNILNAEYDGTDTSVNPATGYKAIRSAGSISDNPEAPFYERGYKMGNYSVSLGADTKATGACGFAMGDASWAAGESSVAIGKSNSAGAAYSVAIGQNNMTPIRGTIAIGKNLNTTPCQEGCIVLGKNNNPKTTTVFEIGYGVDENNRSNAFQIFANGDIGIDGKITTGATVTEADADGVLATVGYVKQKAVTDPSIVKAKIDYPEYTNVGASDVGFMFRKYYSGKNNSISIGTRGINLRNFVTPISVDLTPEAFSVTTAGGNGSYGITLGSSEETIKSQAPLDNFSKTYLAFGEAQEGYGDALMVNLGHFKYSGSLYGKTGINVNYDADPKDIANAFDTASFPSNPGDYVLQCNVDANGKRTFSWELAGLQPRPAVGTWQYGPTSTATLYEGGEMVVSGTGAGTSRYSSYDVPWKNFKNDILSLTIEDGITSIGNYAFNSCTNLALTSLPDSLTSIGENVFEGCKNLTLASLPNSLTSIGSYAFNGCKSLALTSLPTGLVSIGNSTFSGCESLALTSLPTGLVSIGNSTFSGCESLALASLPNGITSIGNNAFNSCTNLALTSLPDNLTSIGENAFRYCTNLALTSLPDNLTSIGENVFEGCTNLALTSLSDSLTSISNYAFEGCTNLALTSLPEGLTSIGESAFSNCINLALTSLPNGITSIGNHAFGYCTNLALTSLPDNLTSVGDMVFMSCPNIVSLTFHSTPSHINSDAFYFCLTLSDIYVPWSEGTVAGAPWGATNATIHYNS